MNKTKVAVIGVGHLGKNHARVYSELDDVELIGVCDTSEERAKEIAENLDTRYYTDYHDLLGKVDAVSVVVPTTFHFEVSKCFLENKVPVLVEKPMTTNSKEARKLNKIAEQNNTLVQVGHIERFNPATVAIKEFHINPKFIEVHRLSPYSFRSADIGVVMDLMIHDIDIILQLAQSGVKRLDACGVSVINPEFEDIANARITFFNGCVANITASRVSNRSVRRIRVFSEDSYITLDYGNKKGYIYKKSPKLPINELDISKYSLTDIDRLKQSVYGDLLTIKELDIQDFEPLKKELESFVDSVRNEKPPLVSGREGQKAIEVAEKIVKKIKKLKWESK